MDIEKQMQLSNLFLAYRLGIITLQETEKRMVMLFNETRKMFIEQR